MSVLAREDLAPRSKCSTAGCQRLARPRSRSSSTLCAACERALADPREDGWEVFAARRWGIGADGE